MDEQERIAFPSKLTADAVFPSRKGDYAKFAFGTCCPLRFVQTGRNSEDLVPIPFGRRGVEVQLGIAFEGQTPKPELRVLVTTVAVQCLR